jgi:hypothetical protein
MSDLKLEEVAFGSIGDKLGLGFGWSDLHIYFDDTTLKAHPSIEIRVPVAYDDDDSIQTVRQRAYRRAIECLQLAIENMEAAAPAPVVKATPVSPSH